MRLPKYRRHSGGGARVTIAGKDYMLGPFGSAKSKREYDRLIGEYIVSGRQKSFGVKKEELLLSELLVAYLKHAKQAYGVTKRGEYYKVKLAIRPLRRLYGSSELLQFGVLQWKNVRQYVLDGKNGKEGDPIRVPTRRYVNTFMQRVTRIFRWAAGDGDMYPGELALKLERIEPLKVGRTKARETEDVEGVPDEIIEKTLEHLPPVVADLVRIQRLVGCRPGELCSLTAGMVDRSTDIWTVDLGKNHKTAHHGKKRVLYIGPKAQDVLRSYLLRGPEEFLFRPRDSEKKRRQALHDQRVTPLSCGNKPGSNKRTKPLRKPGHCYTAQSYARAVLRGCDKAFPPPEGMKKESDIEAWKKARRWSPNQLRHACAQKVRDEISIEAASSVLGHSDIQTTQIYAKRNEKHGMDAARLLG